MMNESDWEKRLDAQAALLDTTPKISADSMKLIDEFGSAEQRVIVKDTNAAVFSAISARDALIEHINKLETKITAVFTENLELRIEIENLKQELEEALKDSQRFEWLGGDVVRKQIDDARSLHEDKVANSE